MRWMRQFNQALIAVRWKQYMYRHQMVYIIINGQVGPRKITHTADWGKSIGMWPTRDTIWQIRIR